MRLSGTMRKRSWKMKFLRWMCTYWMKLCRQEFTIFSTKFNPSKWNGLNMYIEHNVENKNSLLIVFSRREGNGLFFFLLWSKFILLVLCETRHFFLRRLLLELGFVPKVWWEPFFFQHISISVKVAVTVIFLLSAFADIEFWCSHSKLSDI